MRQKRCIRVLGLFYQAFQNRVLQNIHSLIPHIRTSTKQPNTFNSFYCMTDKFPKLCLMSVIIEWNPIQTESGRSSCISYNSFHETLLKFIRPGENRTMRLGFSYLCDHKFQHNFEDTLNPLYPCSIKTKTTVYFFLHCQLFNAIQKILMNDLFNIDTSLPLSS